MQNANRQSINNMTLDSTMMGTITLVLGGLLVLREWHWRQRWSRQTTTTSCLLSKADTIGYSVSPVQLSPHFLFNALATIQNFVMTQQTQLANDHLVKLARLLRNFYTTTRPSDDQLINIEQETTLRTEIEMIKTYVEFEQLQYQPQFDFTVTVADDVNTNGIVIPRLVIYPFIENAIHQRLHHQKGRRYLYLEINKKNDKLLCTIRDNGLNSGWLAHLKRRSIKTYQSQNDHLLKERLKILKQIGKPIYISTNEKNNENITAICFAN